MVPNKTSPRLIFDPSLKGKLRKTDLSSKDGLGSSPCSVGLSVALRDDPGHQIEVLVLVMPLGGRHLGLKAAISYSFLGQTESA